MSPSRCRRAQDHASDDAYQEDRHHHHVRRAALVVVIVGQPGRKTMLRGIRALCARRCKTMYLAHYLMDASTPETRAAFLGEVRRRVGKF